MRSSVNYQHTFAQPVEVSGIGLHSAVPVRIRLLPGVANKGIIFRRTDLDNFEIPLENFGDSTGKLAPLNLG